MGKAALCTTLMMISDPQGAASVRERVLAAQGAGAAPAAARQVHAARQRAGRHRHRRRR